ncbi:hypothetical protein DFQ30_001402 [Apophysomyces sp. BC1015]|nr:hypothetical protein DFQ30_001402 [Apophysomyces sp. BC1015]
MFSWLHFIASAAPIGNVLEEDNEKTMIHSKADAIVKATSVNVLIDDSPAQSFRRDYEPTGATVALSVELQKTLPEFRNPPLDPVSSRLSDIKRQRSMSVSSQSSQLFRRIVHSSKSSAATLPTSVYVNGSVVLEGEPISAVDTVLRSSSLSAVERLSKHTANVLDDGEETLKSQDLQSPSDINNKLNLVSKGAQHATNEKRPCSIEEETGPTPILRQAQASKYNWKSLFGFPSHENSNEETIEIPVEIERSPSPKVPPVAKKAAEEKTLVTTSFTQNNEQPKPAKQRVLSKISSTNDLRHKSSTVSLSSSTKAPKKPNVVLPAFHSQFRLPSEPQAVSKSVVYFNKTLDILQSILIPPKPENDVVGPLWWKRRMHTRFSNFVEEMKIPGGIAGKKIVVVGVHGWFPMKLMRSVIGEPTGTSSRFCEQMVIALRQYFEQEHGVVLPSELITCVPLQGEGKVEDRVNKLYNSLLDNSTWLESVSSADIIFWATHSQGTPVSVMLLHRLLERGHIHLLRQSICLLAMAGITCGPFPALKGSLIVKYFEADAARELFEFMDSNSDISQKFRQSLAYILRSGVKTVLMGSMQDQVVPLYSAIMSGVSHPNILRSVYIDGHIYSDDDFIINLISFALCLRNSGLSDHGLLIYLSEVLAGNLYSLEGGHSTIYEEIGVYTSAVRFLFRTKPFGDLQQIRACLQKQEDDIDEGVEVRMEPFQAKLQQNPYYLPWAMRGICDDAQILKDEGFYKQLCYLRDMFKRWEPSSTKMREIRFRLEPFSSML